MSHILAQLEEAECFPNLMPIPSDGKFCFKSILHYYLPPLSVYCIAMIKHTRGEIFVFQTQNLIHRKDFRGYQETFAFKILIAW